MNIPFNIQKIIGDHSFSIDNVGMSNSQVVCFEDMVLKIEKQSEESNNENKMMSWLADKLPVPKIICLEKSNNINYLLMSKIKGNMLCSSEFLENPKLVVQLLAEGLRMLWDVDITNCPSDSSIDNKLNLAEARVLNNLCDMENVESETYGENGFDSPAHLLEWLKANKPVEELSFSHGDFCLPNIFACNNKISGFIDLGRSGVSDKYHDIALCYRSLQHNFDGRYGGNIYTGFKPEMLFNELKIIADWDLIKYYILLDELF